MIDKIGSMTCHIDDPFTFLGQSNTSLDTIYGEAALNPREGPRCLRGEGVKLTTQRNVMAKAGLFSIFDRKGQQLLRVRT